MNSCLCLPAACVKACVRDRERDITLYVFVCMYVLLISLELQVLTNTVNDATTMITVAVFINTTYTHAVQLRNK